MDYESHVDRRYPSPSEVLHTARCLQKAQLRLSFLMLLLTCLTGFEEKTVAISFNCHFKVSSWTKWVFCNTVQQILIQTFPESEADIYSGTHWTLCTPPS